jgi:hypothetical protein
MKYMLEKRSMKAALLGLISAVLLLTPGPALAHHSGAMFDTTKEVRLIGVIKTFRWSNPHAWIEIDVPDSTGKPVTWGVEMTSPSLLSDDGWKRSTLKVGDKVELLVAPLRDGKPGGSFLGVKLPDGRYLGREPKKP